MHIYVNRAKRVKEAVLHNRCINSRILSPTVRILAPLIPDPRYPNEVMILPVSAFHLTCNCEFLFDPLRDHYRKID